MSKLRFLLFAFTILPALAQTSSPFPPPQARLGVYAVNSGPGLDTGCTYRSGGPLIVQVKVPAPFNSNQLNADGTLKDPSKLTSKGILGGNASIRFPVYDID